MTWGGEGGHSEGGHSTQADITRSPLTGSSPSDINSYSLAPRPPFGKTV